MILYLGAVDFFSDAKSRPWFLRALVLGGGLAGARSLAQRLGLDSSAAGLQESAAFGTRIASCFGNPNFAGGFFALVLPLILHQALAGEGRPWRWLARVAVLLAFLGLALSASKAALLGLLVSAAVAGHLLYWSSAKSELKQRAMTWLGGCLAVAILVGGLSLPGPSLNRLTGGPGAWSDSVDFRLITWAGTWDLGRARPLSGWGPGTFASAYPSYRRPQAMATQVQHAYEVTAPENWPLQLFAEAGILGLATALFALLALLWPLRRASRAWAEDPQGGGLCLALLSCVAACLACNLASLDLFLPSTLLPLILLLALGTALSKEGAPQIPLIRNAQKTRFLASAGIIFLACVPPVQADLHTQAGRALARARALSQAGHFTEAVPDYGLALEYDPSLLEARYFLGCTLLDAGGDTNLANAAQCFAVLQRYAPDYVQVHAKLGRLRLERGQVADAAGEYERQLSLDPWDLNSVQALASLYAEHGYLAQAQAVLAAAASRWPGDQDIARNLLKVEAALRAMGGKR